MASKSKTSVSYKRKQNSAVVTISNEQDVTATEVQNGKVVPAATTATLPSVELETTAPAKVLTVEPASVAAPAAGISIKLAAEGALSTTATFSAATHAHTEEGVATYVYSSHSTTFSDFSSSDYTNGQAMCSAAYSLSPNPTKEFSARYMPAGSSVFTEVKTLTVTCTAKGEGFSASGTTYAINDMSPVAYNGSATIVPVNADAYEVTVAPLPTNDPHYIVDGSGNPLYTGYWEYSATSSYTDLTLAPSYTGYSTTVGTITVTDSATSATVDVPVTQTMPASAGTVFPVNVSAANTATLTPVTILPALGAEAKAYHLADYDNWTVQPNCSWIHFHAPKYNGTTLIKTDVGEAVGCGTISKAAIYDREHQVIDSTAHPKEHAEQAANEKVNIILKTDANTTGHARVAYPTISVGQATYTITVKQNA